MADTTQTVTSKTTPHGTRDEDDIRRFSRIAERWWDPDGDFAPLHKLNPIRLRFIREAVEAAFRIEPGLKAPFDGLSLADVGCGGGLVTEPMARLGASVTALDADPRTIEVARTHAEQGGLEIDYRCGTAEDLAAEDARFDVVLALEVVEHVSDPGLFFDACTHLLKPGGVLILSTLNRSPKGFLLGVVAAEYLLGWLPRGTHNWRQFLRPSEVSAALRARGLSVTGLKGLIYNPLRGRFCIHPHDVDVNYIMTAQKPADV